MFLRKITNMNEILLIMNIDIGLEKPAQLELKKNEDLNEKAKEFCKKYSLHEELVKILVEKIENNLKGNKSSIQSRILKDLEKTNNCFNSNKSKEISNRNSEKKIKPKNDENAGIKLYKRSLYESAKKKYF